ncbi:hypothetical protein TrVE_jg12744 [Triparma verrucosa]|uniref:Uncharacterized protein n=1 Tax=Triparma verrucosa TaxID=1606542 RepID=A0A9W7BZZ0_9STRA|nr:hypothetical protein TrVE_jg12744 [Triparma verrucosa]
MSADPAPTFISFDAIEASLGKPRSPESWKEAREVALRTLTETLTRDPPPKFCIVDDTSHLRSMRKNLVQAICASGRSVELLWLQVTASLAASLERDGGRDTKASAGEESVRKIFQGMQAPGEAGRDGVPVFERGNVLRVSGEDPIEGSALLKMVEESSTYTVEPNDSDDNDSDGDGELPEPPFNPDPVLRTLVSACVSISKSHAQKANSARKDLLKSNPPLDSEQATVEAFSAQMPEIAFEELLKSYEASKWGGISEKTNSLADGKKIFTDKELSTVVSSLKQAGGEGLDFRALKELIKKAGHLSHKDWARTEAFGEELKGVLGTPASPVFKETFERVLKDGGWDRALSAKPADGKPWIVLVTGLNGIRKSTSLYQPWWQDCLSASLGSTYSGAKESLPSGSNSFFRQLDYMICTLASLDFKHMYDINDVGVYSERKASLFKRYRMLSEMLGVLLLKDGKENGINLMLETSGRDVAMYEYIDYLFNDSKYNKLCLNFKINDIKYAESSVDRRMEEEMRKGKEACGNGGGAKDITDVNLGGPYGSEVLAGVKQDSERVWGEVVEAGREGWLFAEIMVEGREEQDGSWKAKAGGKEFDFVR